MRNLEKEKLKLEQIRDRYFRPVAVFPNGHLCHHGNCSIYRSIDVYGTAACTCGFLHDLRILNEGIRAKAYYAFYDELMLEDGPATKLTPKKSQRLFDFESTPQERKDSCIKEWEIIEDVFGKDFRKRKELEWLALDAEE